MNTNHPSNLHRNTLRHRRLYGQVIALASAVASMAVGAAPAPREEWQEEPAPRSLKVRAD